MHAKQLLTIIIRTSGFYLLYVLLYQFFEKLGDNKNDFPEYGKDFWMMCLFVVVLLALLYGIFIRGADKIASWLKPVAGIVNLDFNNMVFCLRVCMLGMGIYNLTVVLFFKMDADLLNRLTSFLFLFSMVLLAFNKLLSVFIARKIVSLDTTRNPVANKCVYIAGIVMLFIEFNNFFQRGPAIASVGTYFLCEVVVLILLGLIIINADVSLRQADFFKKEMAAPGYALPLYVVSAIVVFENLVDTAMWLGERFITHKGVFHTRYLMGLLFAVLLFFIAKAFATGFGKTEAGKSAAISTDEQTVQEDTPAETDFPRFISLLFCCATYLYTFRMLVRFCLPDAGEDLESSRMWSKFFYAIIQLLVTVLLTKFHFWFTRIQGGIHKDLQGLIWLGLLFSGYIGVVFDYYYITSEEYIYSGLGNTFLILYIVYCGQVVFGRPLSVVLEKMFRDH